MDARDIATSDVFGCHYTVPNLQETIGFALCVDGVYEPMLMRVMLDRLPPGSVFIDVGACLGTFTVPAAKSVGECGRVLAIESSPIIPRYLEDNVRANDLRNVILEPHAVSDRAGDTVKFFQAPMACYGSSSCLERPGVSPIAVRTVTLDDLVQQHRLGHADLIKLDVEGYEAAVLRGGRRLLSATTPAPIVCLEFYAEAEARIPGGRVGDAQRILRQLGYEIWRLRDFAKQGRPLQDIMTEGFETLVAMKGKA